MWQKAVLEAWLRFKEAKSGRLGELRSYQRCPQQYLSMEYQHSQQY